MGLKPSAGTCGLSHCWCWTIRGICWLRKQHIFCKQQLYFLIILLIMRRGDKFKILLAVALGSADSSHDAVCVVGFFSFYFCDSPGESNPTSQTQTSAHPENIYPHTHTHTQRLRTSNYTAKVGMRQRIIQKTSTCCCGR